MATSAAFAGQTIACPNCRGEFVFQPPASTPPAAASSDMLPPGASRLQLNAVEEDGTSQSSAATAVAARPREVSKSSTTITSPPSPYAAVPSAASFPTAPAASNPPPAPANVARFKTAASTTTTIAPAADGKLPGLLLADTEGAVAGESGEKGVPLWLACVAVIGSTLVSVFLLFSDTSGKPSTRTKHAEARTQIAQFYGNDIAPLRPYQVLLREAQLAHSRGDHELERQRYRQVLALLRSEKRSKYETITGTPSDDEQLAECLSALLSNE
ncbi:MAG TPA: hypothetical protein VGI40_19355 [Pirellulaceae bacterium]|jgi:hypothetical protein